MPIPVPVRPVWQTIAALIVLLISEQRFSPVAQATGSTSTVGKDAALERGQKVYEEKCVRCHGQNGSGTSLVPAPIFGDRPTSDLAGLIARTMPEDAVGDCEGDDALAVAEWMQKTFYSPEAQARLNPPRIELSRLTVSQYRNAVADLSTSFRWNARPGKDRGLKAEYFSSRGQRRDRRVYERIDATVDFSFGDGSPDGEKIGPEEFSIVWNGSVIPRETGWYEFIVRTENGTRLFVNDNESPLIDAWVRSGDNREFRGSRYLLAGRMYRIRLDWFKFREASASVALAWKPPGSVEELIPESQLSPEPSPEVLIVETPFPPDDRSSGYERGASVSREWKDAVANSAVEVADKLLKTLRLYVDGRDRGRGNGESERVARIREFAVTFVERAFRRPLTDELRPIMIDQQFAAAATPEEGLRRVVLLTLMSPRFLYREHAESGDQFDRAAALSFALLNSIPDKPLLDAARNGQLATERQVRDQAWRLVNDDRARARLLEMLRTWMNLETLHDFDKNPESHPDFSREVAADMRLSLELLMSQTLDSEKADFRQLLLSDTTYMNERLAAFYGIDFTQTNEPVETASQDSRFRKVRFEPERRAGIVSHPYLLSGLAYSDTSSPIHRGVFLSRGILGRGVKPPPIAVAPTAPDLAPHLTTRERVTLQTKADACANCHNLINPLGFGLENFDAVGRYRDTERSRPVDSSGEYLQRNGQLVRFHGVRELAEFLARSSETHRSFARQLFHHLVQQPVLAYGPDTLTELTQFFEQHDFNIRHLAVEIASRSAMHSHSASLKPVVADGRQ